MNVLLAVFAAVSIAFPPERARLASITNCYCIGAAEMNAPLTLNGVEMPLYRTGAFLAMLPVAPGTNVVRAVQGTNVCVRTFYVAFPPDPHAPRKPAPPSKPHDPYADLGIPTNVVCAPPPCGKSPGDVTVMVDPGHGGRDTGALSPHGWKEKDVNLMQARAIRDAFLAAGFKVVMTRDDDSFPPLYDRPRRAWRERVDAFISVHHNAPPANRNPREARHTTTLASNPAGLALAAALQKAIAPVLAPVVDRGACEQSLAVCRNPAVPSCLLEVDFISLPEGEEASWNRERQWRVAEAVVRGFLEWMTSGLRPKCSSGAVSGSQQANQPTN